MLMILKYIFLLILVKTIDILFLTALKTFNSGWVIDSSNLMKIDRVIIFGPVTPHQKPVVKNVWVFF